MERESGPVRVGASEADWRTKAESELSAGKRDKGLTRSYPEGFDLPVLCTRQTLIDRLDASYGSITDGSDWINTREGKEVLVCSRFDLSDSASWSNQIGDDLANGVGSIWLDVGRAITSTYSANPSIRTRSSQTSAVRPDVSRIFSEMDLANCIVMLEPWAEAAERGSFDPAWIDTVRGTLSVRGFHFRSDPWTSLCVAGSLAVGRREAEQAMVDVTRYCLSYLPDSAAITINVLAYHCAGATATQELAIALSLALAYFKVLVRAGIDAQDAASQITFCFAVGKDTFTEIAKLRVARWLWTELLAKAGVHHPHTTIHGVTAPRTLSASNPENNILRQTTEMLAAILGGADIVTAVPFDYVSGGATPLSRRLSRNLPLVLLEECSLNTVCDPAAGSFYVEVLSYELGKAAWQLFQQIDARGGIYQEISSGRLAEALNTSWQEYRRRCANGGEELVGIASKGADKGQCG